MDQVEWSFYYVTHSVKTRMSVQAVVPAPKVINAFETGHLLPNATQPCSSNLPDLSEHFTSPGFIHCEYDTPAPCKMQGINYLSKMTAAVLEDVGYIVDPSEVSRTQQAMYISPCHTNFTSKDSVACMSQMVAQRTVVWARHDCVRLIVFYPKKATT